MSEIESAYKEMMEDVWMSGSMIAYCMKDKALELERELTAAREEVEIYKRDNKQLRKDVVRIGSTLKDFKEQRDEWKAKFIQQNKDLGCEMMDPDGTIWDYAKKLQTELPAVTKQLTKAHETIGTMIDEIGMLELKDKATTEQRDRLAAALTKIQGVGLVAVDAFDELDRIDEIVDEALQSLNQNAQGEAQPPAK